MRIAMDGAIEIEWHVPRTEQVDGDRVARRHRPLRRSEQLLAFDPGHGEQTPGRKTGDDLGDADPAFLREHAAVQGDMPCLTLIVEFLTPTPADLGADLVGPYGPARALVHRTAE